MALLTAPRARYVQLERAAKPRPKYRIRWINLRSGKRGTIPRAADDPRPLVVGYAHATDIIDAWRDRNPNLHFWTEVLA